MNAIKKWALGFILSKVVIPWLSYHERAFMEELTSKANPHLRTAFLELAVYAAEKSPDKWDGLSALAKKKSPELTPLIEVMATGAKKVESDIAAAQKADRAAP